MLQLTPQSRIFLAVQPVDFRKGIDGLAAVCRQVLHEQPLSGAVFVFRNRSATAIKLLFYELSKVRNRVLFSMMAKAIGWRPSACHRGDSSGGHALRANDCLCQLENSSC